MNRVLRDPALQKDLDRDGYVAVPMLAPDEVAALLAALARLDPADAWAPNGSGPALNSYHCSFLDHDKAYKRAAFELLAATFDGVVARYLDGFRALSANFYVKPTGRGQIPVHQNWPVLDSLDATSVTVWCPLVDVDAENGTLHVVPGSHKLVPHVEGPGSLSFFAGYRDDLDDQLVPLCAQAGHGFIFDDSIVHGSPVNRAATPRIAVQITCVPAEARPVFYFRADDQAFELIAADRDFYLESDVTELMTRSEHWQAGQLVPSRNRQIEKAEFVRLLARRRAGREGGGWVRRAMAALLPVRSN